MNTPAEELALWQLVHDHYDASAAWIDHATNPPTLRILRTPGPIAAPPHQAVAVTLHGSQMPEPLAALPWVIQPGPIFHDLRCPLPITASLNVNQDCQDEPIQLGTQIQPAGAPWVGTAGMPVKWIDQHAKPHWGILSNWHVFCGGPTAKGHPQHQPDDLHPAAALLADWNAVTPAGTNYLDAAIADSFLNGFHTISPNILHIGPYGPAPLDAHVGLAVTKSGRTTALTQAECSAVGAAVKINYGDFTATFADQDVFKDTDGHFSAAGDSGSAILAHPDKSPCALLFAGGSDLTIACPIRYAVERFNLVFPFN